MKSFKDFLKVPQTKIGLVFALIVPLLFVVIWMTGYHQATERVDQLQVALVNEDGTQGTEVQKQIETLCAFPCQCTGFCPGSRETDECR
ncbi:hypothetical protein Q0F98_22085 [Paenibacillus amylolyticus]|nr:hypothetical protein Q0F98_22085 [Paenibacillus amylolyticus]